MFADDEFRNLNMPMLLLVGDREVLYDARVAINRARRLIPHIEGGIISEAGHMLSTDQSEAVISRVLRFLRDADKLTTAQLESSHS